MYLILYVLAEDLTFSWIHNLKVTHGHTVALNVPSFEGTVPFSGPNPSFLLFLCTSKKKSSSEKSTWVFKTNTFCVLCGPCKYMLDWGVSSNI